MERVVVLGATGMAGHVISLYLEENGYEVFRTSRSIVPSSRNAQIDFTNCTQTIEWLDEIGPDFIINAMGILPREADLRPDLAVLLNSYLPHKLAQKYIDSRTKIIHLSTDCVFSGFSGGYTETSATDGMTIYDRSKALGEIINYKDLTFRMSIIGPDIDRDGVGLFNWFMRQSGCILGYTKAIWNGVTTIELSKAIDKAIKQNLSGLYHLTPKKSINKHDLLHLFREEFGKIDIEVVPFEDFVVDKTLINTRNDFQYEISTYPRMIREMALWINEHKRLYHYE